MKRWCWILTLLIAAAFLGYVYWCVSNHLGMEAVNASQKQAYEELLQVNEGLAEENASLQTANSALEMANAVLEEQIETLETENAALEEQNAALETENAALEEQNAALETENSVLEEQIEALEAGQQQAGECLHCFHCPDDDAEAEGCHHTPETEYGVWDWTPVGRSKLCRTGVRYNLTFCTKCGAEVSPAEKQETSDATHRMGSDGSCEDCGYRPQETVTPKPTATPEATATPKPTATPEATATPEPTATPTPKPTATPEPTATPGCQHKPGEIKIEGESTIPLGHADACYLRTYQEVIYCTKCGNELHRESKQVTCKNHTGNPCEVCQYAQELTAGEGSAEGYIEGNPNGWEITDQDFPSPVG